MRQYSGPFEFSPLSRPNPGSGFGKYGSWVYRSHGQKVFKDAIQEHPLELPLDPWGLGNVNGDQDVY
jgi:hypothetical protein